MKTAMKWIFLVLCIVTMIIGAIYLWNEEDKAEKNNYAPTSPASLLLSDQIVNIAHRGASGYAPEHTLISYDFALKMDADYLEIDLHMTADGELVAIHDEDVSRTTNGSGLVKDMSLSELKTLDAGSWFNQAYPDKADDRFVGIDIPTLKEILDYFGLQTNYYIEIKDPDPKMIETFLAILEDYHLIKENKVIIQSFSADALQEIYSQYDTIPLIQLLSASETNSANYRQIRQYAIGVGVPYQKLNKKLIEEIHYQDLHIHTYTVNEKADMEQLIRWGVDGIFTDYPDRLVETLRDDMS
ncbi:glycerophosphodiester phosphodiesterase [Gracilibacillus sp. HCP3S3_G5_1]|uniref:glycerophosphodiester phosphodiesterase n=1 Tax=unclassified Gracilibacillus TaxID=2625209 RepID=UPI003F88AB6A